MFDEDEDEEERPSKKSKSTNKQAGAGDGKPRNGNKKNDASPKEEAKQKAKTSANKGNWSSLCVSIASVVAACGRIAWPVAAICRSLTFITSFLQRPASCGCRRAI
jgi:hypothetical protein